VSVARPLTAPEIARDVAGMRAQLEVAEEAAALQPLGLGGVLLGPGVLNRVPAIVAELRRPEGDVALLADRRPMAGADGEVKAGLAAALGAAGLTVRPVGLGDERADVHADARTLRQAVAESAGASLVLSVGSGTIADIGKAVSALLGQLPHVVVQTAASVNGFADDQSVLLVDGVKHTTPTRWPESLVIDSDVVARAPVELNRAGLGDLLATYTAPADWLLARLVGQDDRYSPFAVGLARAHVDAVLDGADGIHRGDPETLENLAAALTLTGISMGVAGCTAPCSGMEHTGSHLLEMAEVAGAPTPLHGAKVGVLAVLAALLWARVRSVARAGGLHALRFPPAQAMEPRVRAAFAELDPSGQAGEKCWQDYARKLERWNAAREELVTLPQRWPAFDAELDALLTSPERLVAALRAARAPVRLTQLGVRDATARWAIAHGHLMRDRFTVADLAFFMGIWDDADVDALLVSAARLGAGL
jgi:glycerol-1-phosphate dehydrogenase [NAD(P)+]